MTKFLQGRLRVERSLVLVVGALGVFSGAGCAVATDGTDGPGAADEPTGALTQAFHAGGPTLAWRGAAPNTVMESSRFSEIDVVYGMDIGISEWCHTVPLPPFRECFKYVRGLQVFSYNQESNSTYASTVGQTTAGSWTRELCPNGGVAVGYWVGVGNHTGQTRIEKFGLQCVTTAGVRTDMPILGSANVFFAEEMSCKPQAASPVSWIGNIRMNFAGNGIGAICIKP